jgi:hypothetical protein
MEDKPDHGTHVAGIASACTNNGIGIAGIGYQCKIMPVKASQDNFRGDNGAPYIVYGYDGILYAAKNGCKVINCSWGGYGYSSFGEEVVNRATVLGALVVAAAGNDNTQDAHYPSSFHKALSVASTSSGDMKSAFSNYGTGVDVCSPGEAILSTWMNDTYYYNNGTSMASPLAAGLAGLVAARFPSFTAEQIREQIRVTCDNIAPMNPGLRGQIGSGRINARNAVSNTAAVSVRTNDIIADDSAGDNDGVIEPGETIKLKITFTNYLRPISAMNIGLESTSPYAEVIVSNYFPGSIGEYVSFTNTDHPYTVKIAPNTPYNTRLTFVLNYINGGTIAEEAFSLLANPSYATQKGNDISLTITSKGNFGFADYPDNLQGDGFRYKNSGNLLFEGAIIMGTSASKLSNSARNANQGKAQDADFTTLLPFTIIQPGNAADVEGSTVMNDNGNPSGGMGLELHTNTYTYTTAGNENYIILRNRIRNTTTGSISNFYFGLYTDWDMTSSGGDDYTQFDALGKLGYCYHTVGTGNIYTATALLTNSSPLYWGILNDGGDGGFSIYDGFSDQEKWTALGGGKDRAGAGDVSFVLGTGPFSIAAGKTIDIAFALCAGNTIQELRDAAAKAAVKYQAMNPGIPPASYAFALSQNYPNPFNSGTKIDFQLEAQGWTEIKLYDFLGRFISTVFSGELDAGTYSVPFAAGTLSSGIYFYELVSSGNSATRKMIVLR